MVVKWTRTAIANLGAIAEYIAKGNLDRAHSFAREIRQKTNLLAQFTGAGRAGRVPGTRELVVHENYIVAYRVKGEDVQIIRVHHAAQKYPNPTG